MQSTPIRLTDEQMHDFIRQGFVSIKTDFPPDFHAYIRRQLDTHLAEKNPGNNLLPVVPEIQEIFNHPAVDGALSSVLGDEYYLHPHRFCHVNTPGNEGQQLHKDSWSKLHHRTRWGMAFYYPQDTTEDMGPTGVVPASQYYNTGPGNAPETPVVGEAGTVAIVHYDLWHRAMPNSSDKTRYMVKFLFTRLEEPQEPSWESSDTSWSEQGVCQSVWNWYCGTPDAPSPPPPNAYDLEQLRHGLEGAKESESFQAAYALGAMGEEGLAVLLQALKANDDTVRRNAGYGLTAAGKPAVAPLTDIVADANQSDETRVSALDVLGDIGKPAASALPALVASLKEASTGTRQAAATALGTLNGAARPAVPAMIDALRDEDEWVRRNVALSFLRLGKDAEEATPALIGALKDENRYVRAKAAKTLERIATPESLKALMQFYETSMWCPITANGSAF